MIPFVVLNNRLKKTIHCSRLTACWARSCRESSRKTWTLTACVKPVADAMLIGNASSVVHQTQATRVQHTCWTAWHIGRTYLLYWQPKCKWCHACYYYCGPFHRSIHNSKVSITDCRVVTLTHHCSPWWVVRRRRRSITYWILKNNAPYNTSFTLNHT